MLKKKLLFPILSTVVLVGAISAVPLSTQASVLTKNVKASYNNIKVKYNGSQVATTIEPFIIDGTTYIPLRMMADVFNKNIAWDGSTYTINVQDKPDSRVQSLEAEIASLKSQIASKDAKIEDLQDELDDDDSSNSDDIDDVIDDLEETLNDDYGDFEDLDLDISLSGDEDDVEVEISIDLDEVQDEYESLSDSDLEGLVEDIMGDIWDESDLEDADISGTIIDTSDDDNELHDFSGEASDEYMEFDGDEI